MVGKSMHLNDLIGSVFKTKLKYIGSHTLTAIL